METLKQVQEFLNDIPYINKGGCGIAALSMFRWLKNKGQISGDTYFLYMYTWCTGSYELNESYFNMQSDEICSCAHAVLHHDGYYHDSKSLYDMDNLYTQGYQFFHEINNEKILVESINNINAWNDSFERAYVEDIATALDIDLSDIKCY